MSEQLMVLCLISSPHLLMVGAENVRSVMHFLTLLVKVRHVTTVCSKERSRSFDDSTTPESSKQLGGFNKGSGTGCYFSFLSQQRIHSR